MSDSTIYLDWENDKILKVRLKDVAEGSLTETPLTTGTVTAWIASTPDGDAADPSLVGACEHVSDGNWRVAFDASMLDRTVLDGLFAATPSACYCVVKQPGGFRTYIPLTYRPEGRPATVR